jgi:hypothetical protein
MEIDEVTFPLKKALDIARSTTADCESCSAGDLYILRIGFTCFFLLRPAAATTGLAGGMLLFDGTSQG